MEDDDFDFDFEKIEEERKRKMNRLYGEIIRERAVFNEEIEHQEIVQESVGRCFPGNTNTQDVSYISNTTPTTIPNTIPTTIPNTIPTTIPNTIPTTMPYTTATTMPYTTATTSQIEEAIANFTPPDPSLLGKTNLQLAPFYLTNYVFQANYLEIEKNIRIERQSKSNEQILKLKIEINKRLNQVNNDPQKVYTIGNLLKPLSNSRVFVEIFTCKFMEQSIVQISRNLDTHRQFAYLFKMVATPDLFSFYKVNLVQKPGEFSSLRGLYGGFFGVLVELELIDELWAFGAGLLNGEYNENMFIVLEVYLIVGGGFIRTKSQNQFDKLKRYIKNNVIREIKDRALCFRIEKLVEN